MGHGDLMLAATNALTFVVWTFLKSFRSGKGRRASPSASIVRAWLLFFFQIGIEDLERVGRRS